MTITTIMPKIWVVCLSSYNAGKLHGTWIDATQDIDDIWSEIHEMLAESPEPDAEEWGVFDHEGFEGYEVSEYENIEKISEIAKLIAEHGKAYAAYIDHVGIDYATPEDFESDYFGCWESEEEFAREKWEDDGILSKLERLGISERYIDWESVARDLFMGDYYGHQENYGEVYVFIRN